LLLFEGNYNFASTNEETPQNEDGFFFEQEREPEVVDKRKRPPVSKEFFATLVKPTSVSNPIWKHFSLQKTGPKHDAYCVHCRSPVARGKSNSPTNLVSHFKRNHRKIYDSHVREENAQNSSRNSIYNKPRAIRDALIKIMVEGHLPYTILKGEGLSDLFRELGYHEGPPDARTIQLRMCELEAMTKAKLKILLQDQKVAITTDGWKSANNVDYLAVTATWIADSWNLYTVTLDCSSFHGRHTSARISERVLNVIDS
jgi:BED zinc finger